MPIFSKDIAVPQHDVERAAALMRIAAQFIKDSGVDDRPLFYDGAEYDGACLSENLKVQADILIDWIQRP